MAKYFLGSVGTAEAFRMNNGQLELAFVSKTLTDSGLTISTTKDDVRAGTGAPIQFSFYHDPSVEITLTDVIFEEAYVEAQLGGKFETGAKAYKSDTVEAKANQQGEVQGLFLEDKPETLNIGCGNTMKAIWYKENTSGAEYQLLDPAAVAETYTEGYGYKISGLDETKKYCFRYVHYNDAATALQVTSDIIPQELFLVITAPIYAGDACNASNGKKAGTITFEVPRFKLNGSQEFSMNMSSNQTMSLAGIALATDDGCDITGANLLRIIKVIDNDSWYTNVLELIADEDYLAVGDVPHIYALYKNNSITLIDNDKLEFKQGDTDALDANGEFAVSGAVTIKVYDKDGKAILADTVTVAGE